MIRTRGRGGVWLTSPDPARQDRRQVRDQVEDPSAQAAVAGGSRVLARKLAPAFVNTAQSIGGYYNGKGAPDANQLKQAVDLQAEIDKLVEAEVKVRDAID